MRSRSFGHTAQGNFYPSRSSASHYHAYSQMAPRRHSSREKQISPNSSMRFYRVSTAYGLKIILRRWKRTHSHPHSLPMTCENIEAAAAGTAFHHLIIIPVPNQECFVISSTITFTRARARANHVDNSTGRGGYLPRHSKAMEKGSSFQCPAAPMRSVTFHAALDRRKIRTSPLSIRMGCKRLLPAFRSKS